MSGGLNPGDEWHGTAHRRALQPCEDMLGVAVVMGQGFPEGLARRLNFERQATLREVSAR